MDSFYDQPRNAPKPTDVRKFTTPLIPEVSLIQPSTTRDFRQPINNFHSPRPIGESYNVWKARNVSEPSDNSFGNKENFTVPHSVNRQFSDSSACFRKQVRFESPKLHRSQSNPISKNSAVSGRTLEEIYLGNIPNRNLDLSVIDVGKCENKVGKGFDLVKKDEVNSEGNCYDIYNYKNGFDVIKEKPKPNELMTYADFKQQQINVNSYKNDSYKSKFDDDLYSRDLCKKLTSDDDERRFFYKNDHQLDIKKKDSDEPTTRDLLKVIQRQNEQILLLQKQVACLLESKSNQKQIEDSGPEAETPEKYKKLKKGPLSKIAIDVMTSFEVSFRPQNQNLQRNKIREFEGAKIEEITDANNILDGIKKIDNFEKTNTEGDVSISLREPLKVVERCPSPEQSIHVDMQDYSSDEEDSNSDDLGWTIYNNIMGQVNNIFQNAQTNPKTQANGLEPKDKTLRKVKEVTMKHLKSVGVNLPLIEENESQSNTREKSETNDEFNSPNVSYAVKQLLMKYLPGEQLTKVTNRNENQENLIKKRPEFSLATIQYMKKYNLLASDDPKGQIPLDPNQQKILDVTALKQQPKLL